MIRSRHGIALAAATMALSASSGTAGVVRFPVKASGSTLSNLPPSARGRGHGFADHNNKGRASGVKRRRKARQHAKAAKRRNR